MVVLVTCTGVGADTAAVKVTVLPVLVKALIPMIYPKRAFTSSWVKPNAASLASAEAFVSMTA